MRASVLKITPEVAKVMLDMNNNNRPINKVTVARYAEEMKAGRWKLNGEPIIINGHRLLDGQHRLHACVRSGVSFSALVVEDVGDDVFDTIDQGDKRTASNVLSIAGVPNGNIVAGAVRWITNLKASIGKGSINTHEGARLCSSAMVLDYVRKNPDIAKSARAALNAYAACKVFVPSMLTAFHYMFSEINQEDADSFISALGSGEGLREGDPRLTLRNRMIDRSTKLHKERNEWVAILFIYSWNAYREGRRLTKLLYREGDRIPSLK